MGNLWSNRSSTPGAIGAVDGHLSDVSENRLQQPCSDEHIREISLHVTKWLTIAPWLELSEGDEEAIKAYSSDPQAQQLKMLRLWKQRFGERATYRGLAGAFSKVGREDLVELIVQLLSGDQLEGIIIITVQFCS